MSRFLMATVPAYGVANPSFPFTRALTAAGHEVDYLLTEGFRGKVEQCGARLIPYGAPLGDKVISTPKMLPAFRHLFAGMNDGIRRFGNRYDAVIAGFNPSFKQVQRELDVPMILLSPVFLQNERVLDHLLSICTEIPGPMRSLMGRRWLRRALMSVIGPLVMDARPEDFFDLVGAVSDTLNITPASRSYQPFPDDFDPATTVFAGPTTTISAPDDTFPLDRVASHDGPVVYATLGTVFNGWLPYFRIIADAFAGTDALVVLTTGSREHLAELEAGGGFPDNVIARSFVPQSEILAHADVCFTHGGFGSATDAVAATIPILTPMGADQFFNAYRIQELGAGRVLAKKDFSVPTVRAAFDKAMTEGPSTGLLELRHSFRTAPGPDGAVRAIEAVL
ncbi:nucleotide disphospho-sugar-binding domain-containing protein [Nigerium massiliense]|uniref:nucleotide disphospho-sugar-binding domain-containing protein n=1 Tax=Nigerium massiliense TaxID=1522317 RepID=UPI0009E40BFC|nr:nucleotide disphospho-sugar-binding domain-containing protein [Nigerium massiliense]